MSYKRKTILDLEPDNLKINSTDDLLIFHERICTRARQLMKKKNSDYGGKGEPFRNFHGFGSFGILVRLSDKIARMRTFNEKLKNGEALAVISESIEDTAIDAINYVILFIGYIRTWGAEK
jgi:hypothetical protein